MTLDSRSAALRINRKNMASFIRADAVVISLSRSQREQTPAGGWVQGPPVTLPPQTFRLTPFKRRLYNFDRNSTAGSSQIEDYVLVGYWDADVEVGDFFTYNENLYTIDSVEPKMDDRTRTDRVVAKITIQVEDKEPPV